MARIPKSVRNGLISTVVLLVILLGAGTAYTLYMDQKPVTATASDAAPTAAETNAPIVAHKPTADAKEGAAIEALTSPVTPGSNASVSVRTQPTSKCSISVTYGKVASTDSGLTPKIAGDFGDATWSWTVVPTTPVGTWPVKIVCTYNGRSAVVVGDLVVQR